MSKISILDHHRQPAPSIENRKVPKPVKYSRVREREYLTPEEVDKMAKAAKAAKSVGRHGHRDYTMIMVAYRHAIIL